MAKRERVTMDVYSLITLMDAAHDKGRADERQDRPDDFTAAELRRVSADNDRLRGEVEEVSRHRDNAIAAFRIGKEQLDRVSADNNQLRAERERIYAAIQDLRCAWSVGGLRVASDALIALLPPDEGDAAGAEKEED